MRTEMSNFWKRGFVTLFCVAGTIIMANDERNVEFAVGKAAEQAIVKMSAASNVKGVDTIAFIGLGGDRKGYSSAFRADLQNVKSRFKFYTRKEVEWGMLTKEIEIGRKRGDIMDAKTLQKFGDFKGVQAYLYGAVREATVDPDGTAVFRVTLTLSKIETGEQIWEGNVVGRYKGAITRGSVNNSLILAAKDAGNQIKEKLVADRNKLPKCNIFVLPILGEKASAVSDVIISQLVITGDDKLALFSNPSSVDPLAIQDIAADLEANSPTYSSRQLTEIMKKLEKMYNVNPNAVGKGKYGSSANTYLIARVINATGDDEEGKLLLDVKLRDFANNKILWSETVNGSYVKKRGKETFNEMIKRLWKENSILIMIVGGILVVVLPLGIFIMVVFGGFRIFTRAR